MTETVDGAAVTQGEILSHKRYGEHYHSLTIVAPEIGATARPGQFVNVALRPGGAHILRRPFSIHRLRRSGAWVTTLEIVFDIRGAGTEYLAGLGAHDQVDLLGPLGRGFPLPNRPASCLLVGGGIGAAPLFFLADELRTAGQRVDFVLGARRADLLLNAIEVRRLASAYTVTTDDGSAGEQGLVTDVLPDMMERASSEVVYACGPDPMLAAVSALCAERRVPVQVAVEQIMACGYGVCMSCVVPLRRKTSRSGEVIEHVRSCTEGPVFNGAQIVWDGFGAIATEPAPAGN
jgi:dihydroorotate dehydrogenase electron transfer subunit